ncbi:MAG: MarR family transcriptional regulator [Ardenticatenia bacterium]|nr:MarR family transcriptional regulator [Ardenticatenia bacterium]
MDSIFNPETQHQDVGAKVVAALERLTHLLRHLVWNEAKAHGLSPIQVHVLISLLVHEPARCRISQLAREFQVTQPTVSDAVASLVAKGLVVKRPFPADRRAALLELTPAGRKLAEHLAEWGHVLKTHVDALPAEMRHELMIGLMELIASLQRAGLIEVARMCLTCRFFQPNRFPSRETPHYCLLIERPLAVTHLRLDCPEQEPAA